MSKVPVVYVIYYSTYGHIEKLARRVVKGLEESGVQAKLFQVPETLPTDVLEKMHAPPKAADVPVITVDQLPEADGFLFGVPTRFGTVPTQIKSLFDSCGKLWFSGALWVSFLSHIIMFFSLLFVMKFSIPDLILRDSRMSLKDSLFFPFYSWFKESFLIQGIMNSQKSKLREF